MKKIFALIAIIALASGCTDDEMEKFRSRFKPPTQDRPLTAPDGLKAKRLSEVLERHRRTIDGDIQDVTTGVKEAMADKNFADLQVIEALQKDAEKAMASIYQMSEELVTLDRELRHGVHDFASYAQSFRARAEDFKDPEMKQHELVWATHYEQLARELPEERKRVAAFSANVPPLLEFTRQSKKFLDDYALFLATYHDATFPTSEAARYQSGYKRYISQFEQFQKVIDAYRQTPRGE